MQYKYAQNGISDKENRPLIRATVLINSKFSLNFDFLSYTARTSLQIWTMMMTINYKVVVAHSLQ